MTSQRKAAGKPLRQSRKEISAAVDQLIAAFTQDYEAARADDPDLDDRIERDLERMRRQATPDPPKPQQRRRKA